MFDFLVIATPLLYINITLDNPRQNYHRTSILGTFPEKRILIIFTLSTKKFALTLLDVISYAPGCVVLTFDLTFSNFFVSSGNNNSV